MGWTRLANLVLFLTVRSLPLTADEAYLETTNRQSRSFQTLPSMICHVWITFATLSPCALFRSTPDSLGVVLVVVSLTGLWS